ncbi:starch-binding domain-containing protein 1 [Tenrec ecaudatus]|uniref:starch-binding domain-containing protein 1 n=1 Tax=Tenrec ecaudatus TaxID=94439 RepID=UPI003F596E57
MGAVWSALLFGGSLAGALLAWLLRDGPPGGELGGGARPSLQPAPREQVPKPAHLQGNNGCLLSETTGLGKLHPPQEAAWTLHSPPGADGDGPCGSLKGQVSSGQSPDTASLAALGGSSTCSEVPRHGDLDRPVRGWGFQKAQETPSKEAPCFAESAPPSNLQRDRPKEVSPAHSGSSELAEQQEDWEMVSRHSSWGDAGLNSGLEALVLSASQGVDCGQSALGEAKGQEVKTVALFPEAQQVSVRFQVHYVTGPGEQFIAVTGDHERLGGWSTYIPLQGSKDGFWSRPIALPADTVVQWKFVVVEKGEVTRWEECSNRLLETGHEDKVVQEWWGLH